jgi:hypothetical protein
MCDVLAVLFRPSSVSQIHCFCKQNTLFAWDREISISNLDFVLENLTDLLYLLISAFKRGPQWPIEEPLQGDWNGQEGSCQNGRRIDQARR